MIQTSLLLQDMKGSGGVLSFGVHEGAEFLGFEKDFTGDFADLKYGNAEGTVHKRLFKPSGKFLRDGENIETAVQREETENLKHVARILQIALGEKANEVEAPTYDAYLDKAVALLAPFKGTKVNLRVSPKPAKTGGMLYPDLGNYPASYVEAHVPGKPSSLRLSKAHLEMIQPVATPPENALSVSDLV